MNKKSMQRGLNKQEISGLKSVYEVAKQCNYEAKHTKHVTKLALMIYDDLLDLHQLGKQERYYLLCAALLHDIGVHTEGAHAHHKTTLNIILNTPLLKFNQKERLVIGSIARYHRRALPSLKHDHFKALNPEERKIVSILAGILRVADGLDYSHRNRIQLVKSSFSDKNIKFKCYAKKFPVKKETDSAKKKSKLLAQTFNRQIVFKMKKLEEFSDWH